MSDGSWTHVAATWLLGDTKMFPFHHSIFTMERVEENVLKPYGPFRLWGSRFQLLEAGGGLQGLDILSIQKLLGQELRGKHYCRRWLSLNDLISTWYLNVAADELSLWNFKPMLKLLKMTLNETLHSSSWVWRTARRPEAQVRNVRRIVLPEMEINAAF